MEISGREKSFSGDRKMPLGALETVETFWHFGNFLRAYMKSTILEIRICNGKKFRQDRKIPIRK
jgi:hypothetical protein